MRISVPKEVLDNTIKCPHAFSCIDSEKCGEHAICEVDCCEGGENALFLAAVKDANCPYLLPFGYSHLCTCPTRYAIFRRYGRSGLQKAKVKANISDNSEQFHPKTA